jgi:hypothetical protein
MCALKNCFLQFFFRTKLTQERQRVEKKKQDTITDVNIPTLTVTKRYSGMDEWVYKKNEVFYKRRDKVEMYGKTMKCFQLLFLADKQKQ